MENQIDIHNYDQKLNSILNSIEKSELSKKNKELLIKFQNACFSQSIGKAKIVRYLFDLKKVGLIIKKDLDNCNKEDIQKILAEIEKSTYAYNTKRGYKIVLKKFYKWLRNLEEGYPDEVRWIKTTSDKAKERLPSNLLSEEDIIKLIQNADKIRDKAFISVLYESGCRIGEILTLRIKDVTFDNYGAKISVFGKTGARVVRLISSSPYLLEWLNNGHPNNKDNEKPIWLSQKKKLLSYSRIKDMLRDVAKGCGIDKAVNPHSFRHARATYLAKHLSEAQLKAILGWGQASKMSAVYIHLSQKDTEDAILKLNGIIKEESEKSKIELKECPRCKNKNKPTSRFCEMCSMILDKEEADKIIKSELEKEKLNNFMNELSKDTEFISLLKKKLNQ